MVSTFPRLVDESRDVVDAEVSDEAAERSERASEERTHIPSLHFSVMLQRMVFDFARFPEQKYSRTRISPSHASLYALSVLVPSSVIKASRVFPFVFISMPPSESAHSYLSSAFGGTFEETVGTTDGAIPLEITSVGFGDFDAPVVDCGTTETESDFESDFAQALRTQE